jgi:hypothetical protein
MLKVNLLLHLLHAEMTSKKSVAWRRQTTWTMSRNGQLLASCCGLRGLRGLLWTSVDFCGLLWTSVDFCGLLWTSVDFVDFVDFCGLLWTSVDLCGLRWTSVDFCGLRGLLLCAM